MRNWFEWSINIITQTETPNIDPKKYDVPVFAKFIIAGLSGMAAGLILQPIDLIKVRLQVNGEGGVQRDHTNFFHAVKNIIYKEGALALYNGTSANLCRQAIYTSGRFGFYNSVMALLDEEHYAGFQTRALILAGFVGAFVITPLDVAVVRMMADGRLPIKKRRNYKNVFNALYRIGKEDGLVGLWAGTIPTLFRALTANFTQIISYTQFKSIVTSRGYLEDNTICHFVCSTFSGFVCTTAACPFDTCKTRIQTMKTENGIPTYKGLIDVWTKTVKSEGITALWKGYGPLSIRTTQATVLLFVISEKLNVLYKHYVMGNTNSKIL